MLAAVIQTGTAWPVSAGRLQTLGSRAVGRSPSAAPLRSAMISALPAPRLRFKVAPPAPGLKGARVLADQAAPQLPAAPLHAQAASALETMAPGKTSDPAGEQDRAQAGRMFDNPGRGADSAGVPSLTAPPFERERQPESLKSLIGRAMQDGRLDSKTGEELKRAAYTDSLTGVRNRLYFNEQGQSLAAQYRTILAFKLDWLKEINDTQGHAVGDQYLAETARIVSRLLAADGALVRRGPTSFSIFTNLSGREAELLAETLRAAVSFRLAGRRSPVYDARTRRPVRSTIQLGIAEVPGALAQRLTAAERSRQTAKDAGGDRAADDRGRLLERRSPWRLRLELQAAGLGYLRRRLELELSRRPLDEIAAPIRNTARVSDMLHQVQDRNLRRAVADYFFRNALSGLFNRTWLDEHIAGLLAAGRAQRYAALDLDKFGEINRALGEARADRIIARFGALLGEAMAGRDVVALHLSGEEFCLLIGPGEKDVRALLDGLRQKVQDELGARALRDDGVAGPDGRPLRVTLSIGEARVEPRGASPLAVFLEAGERAERALSAAKAQGRNRVILEQP